MISVLARAAALVEQLAAAGAGGLALREAAARAGLPPATATRLLHDLCILGWADQQGQRGRYRLGPRLEALVNRQPYHGRLVAAATPVLARLAGRQRYRCVLAVLRENRRIVLIEHHGSETAKLQERDDLYGSASGRMLVAQLGWRDRQRLVAAIGLPQAGQWREASDWPGLHTACATARRQGWIINDPAGPFIGIGLPVPDAEGGIAALGVAVEKARWRPAVVASACRAAATISRRLGARWIGRPHGHRTRHAQRS